MSRTPPCHRARWKTTCHRSDTDRPFHTTHGNLGKIPDSLRLLPGVKIFRQTMTLVLQRRIPVILGKYEIVHRENIDLSQLVAHLAKKNEGIIPGYLGYAVCTGETTERNYRLSTTMTYETSI